jgi:hypothetical protein
MWTTNQLFHLIKKKERRYHGMFDQAHYTLKSSWIIRRVNVKVRTKVLEISSVSIIDPDDGE